MKRERRQEAGWVLEFEHRVQILRYSLFLFFESLSSLGFPPLMTFNQFREVTRLLGHPHKLVFEEFAGCWTLLNPKLHKDTKQDRKKKVE